MRSIYLDNSATTPVETSVVKIMTKCFLELYGNPSEYHLLGTKAKKVMEESRSIISKFLGSKPDEIIFTSSASESINLAIKGLIETKQFIKRGKRPHIITSQIEHKSVLESCRHLSFLNLADITYLPTDKYGLVNKTDLIHSIKDETVLVTIMYVNNEVGTIEPIRELGQEIKRINSKRKNDQVFFHTDATQALGYLNCNVNYLGVDMLSFSGHKIYAPKGIGVLFKKKKVPLERQIDGGFQEFGLRSGTENVPYIAGIGKAIGLISKKRGNKNFDKMFKYRDYLINGVLKIPGVMLTGHPKKRAPHIASFCIDQVEGESMVLKLSDLGIFASSGSACTASDLQPSHVLTAMGIPPEKSHGSLRFSLGKNTTKKDVLMVVDKLPKIVNKLRRMAPELNTI